MEESSWKTLITYSLSGEENAFTMLYKESAQKIRKQMRKAKLCEADIEDVIQESMIRVYARLSELRDPECYEAWLYKIAKSVYLLQLNKQKKYITTAHIDWIEEKRCYMKPENCIEQMDVDQQLNQHLQKLKISMKEVIVLRYIEELSEEEIAIQMKIPKGTVKSRLHYARARLVAQA